MLRGSWPPAMARSAEEVVRTWEEREANDSIARATFFLRSYRFMERIIFRDLQSTMKTTCTLEVIDKRVVLRDRFDREIHIHTRINHVWSLFYSGKCVFENSFSKKRIDNNRIRESGRYFLNPIEWQSISAFNPTLSAPRK